MKEGIRNYFMITLIVFSCTALSATTFSACGADETGTTTEDGVKPSGDDGDGEVADGPTTRQLVADALAKIAINSALRMAFGVKTDEDWAFVEPELNSCGNGFCEVPDERTATCPEDCSCGDGACDIAETAADCPADCPTPVCGDGDCFYEEAYSEYCAEDCDTKFNFLKSLQSYECNNPAMVANATIYRNADRSSELFGMSVSSCGYDNDDIDGNNLAAIFIDFHAGVTDVVVDGITFTCLERTYPQECLEGSAQFVFQQDGTIAVYTAMSGKVYAIREASAAKADDEAIAEVIVGSAASGTIVIPSPPLPYNWPSFSVIYNSAEAHYLEPDGNIAAPDREICQSFMMDWTLIAPDWWFGPPDGLDWPYDDDGNGLAGCDDPVCADHPACTMSYCPPDTGGYSFNFHGAQEHPSCEGTITLCGNGTCDADEDVFSCPADCTCGNGVCDAGEDATNCALDCDYCGNGICGKGEDNSTCPQDCP